MADLKYPNLPADIDGLRMLLACLSESEIVELLRANSIKEAERVLYAYKLNAINRHEASLQHWGR